MCVISHQVAEQRRQVVALCRWTPLGIAMGPQPSRTAAAGGHHGAASGAPSLTGGEGQLRLRVGDYRVIYQVEDEHVTVRVIRIRDRREIFNRVAERRAGESQGKRRQKGQR
jgi:hypothetical protein